MTRGHNVSLPQHQYVWVVPSFVLQEPHSDALIPAVWWGVAATHGRAITCHVLLKCGALVVDLPLHALRSSPTATQEVHHWECGLWDCYGDTVEVAQPPYLSGLACEILDDHHQRMGETGTLRFLFDHMGDGYSARPEQHKHLWIIEHHAGHYVLLPQDRFVVTEKSFTVEDALPRIKRQDTIHFFEDA